MDWKKYKIEVLLALTVFIGFLLRVINANTRMVYGDPAHFVIHAINFLHSGLLSVWDQSAFLWYALTNIFYNIFGITQFASRFSSILFGTLTIIALYLFTKEFFKNKRIALISAFFYAMAPIFIFNAADEHDITLIFFIVASFYCLLKGLNNNSKKYFIFSAIFFGLGGVVKAYMPYFAIPWVLLVLYYHYRGRFNIKENYKIFLIVLIIILLLVSPTFIYEYLNYHHNQTPLYLFAKFFKIYDTNTENLYGWIAGNDLHKSLSFYDIFIKTPDYSSPSSFYPGWWVGLKYMMYNQSPWLLILGIISLVLLFIRRKEQKARDYLIFYAFYFIIPFLLLVGSILLDKHYVSFFVFLLPPIAFLIDSIYLFLQKNSQLNNLLENYSYILYFLLILILFFTILSMPFGVNGECLFSKNSEGQFISYKSQNIPQNSLVIYDDRIYNSMAGWLLNDRYYLPVSSLDAFLSYNQNSTNKQSVPVYIIECDVDQCSWPTTPEINASMEGFFDYIKSQSPAVQSIIDKTAGHYYNPLISSSNKQNYFSIYKTKMDIDLNLAAQVKASYNYFLYPINYDNKQQQIFQKFIYTPSGFFENFINNIAWIIFYLDIILAFIVIILIFYELYHEI